MLPSAIFSLRFGSSGSSSAGICGSGIRCGFAAVGSAALPFVSSAFLPLLQPLAITMAATIQCLVMSSLLVEVIETRKHRAALGLFLLADLEHANLATRIRRVLARLHELLRVRV